MRLSAIEATRYGALEGACLTGLGDGLTVVLGPNESGKSTMTALTRHVLYGYPDGRSKERGYAPPAGPRAARLVFEDASGQWAIERVDGRNRGPVTIVARGGGEREGLLGELVGGVSEQTYRVVFGFGLDELAQIESGDNGDITARLYAAGAGLAINPMDARKRLFDRASGLYLKGGQKPLVNALAAEMRELKARIGQLEALAADYALDQSRLADLEAQLEPLRDNRDSLESMLLVLEQDAARLADAVAENDRLAPLLIDCGRAIADAERAVALVDVNERVLAAAPELTAVLDDASGFRARVDAAASALASAEDARRRALAIAVPPLAIDNAENRAMVESSRDRLSGLRAKAQTAEESARQAEGRARASQQVADAVAPVAAPVTSSAMPIVLAAVLALAGIAFAVVGMLGHQFLAEALGAAVVVVGVAALVVALVRKPSAAVAEAPLSLEAARMTADAYAAREFAAAAASDLEAAVTAWRAWLSEHGLDAHGDDPAAVRALLDEASQRQRLLGDAEAHVATAAREQEVAEAWVVRLVDAVRRYDESSAQIPPLSEAMALAERARHDLKVARAAADERAKLVRDLEDARSERTRFAQRLEAATATITAIAERHTLAPNVAAAEISILLERTREARIEARDAYDQVAQEYAGLRAKLDNEGRGGAMARSRQELESLRVRATDAADRYLVGTLSVHLLDRARERYERERQPEVVQVAGSVFSAMTAGRYVGVRVPLDNSGISVLTSEGGVRSTSELSRGTAEQLYLALRVGLIRSLGATGAALPVLMDDVVVNFDPERRAGAVAAVAALSDMRQVLYFTCHPDTAALLAEGVPGARVVELDRCELT